MGPDLLRAVIKMNGYVTTCQGRVEVVFEFSKWPHALPPIEVFLNSSKEAGFPAAVFPVDEQVLRITKTEIVNGGSGKAAKVRNSDFGNLQSRPSIIRTTSSPFNAKSAA